MKLKKNEKCMVNVFRKISTKKGPTSIITKKCNKMSKCFIFMSNMFMFKINVSKILNRTNVITLEKLVMSELWSQYPNCDRTDEQKIS